MADEASNEAGGRSGDEDEWKNTSNTVEKQDQTVAIRHLHHVVIHLFISCGGFDIVVMLHSFSVSCFILIDLGLL